MRKQYHWSIKLLAFVLAVCSAVLLALSGASVVYNLNWGMYGDVSLEDRIDREVEDSMGSALFEAANAVAAEYVRERFAPEEEPLRELWIDYIGINYYYYHDLSGDYLYQVRSSSGVVLADGGGVGGQTVTSRTWEVSWPTGKVVDLGEKKYFPEYDQLPEGYEWLDAQAQELPDVDDRAIRYDLVYPGDGHVYRVEYFDPVILEVELFLTQAQVDELAAQTQGLPLMKAAYSLREDDIGIAVSGAVLLLLATVYLCFAAGKMPGTMEIRPRGTNCIPLDLFGFNGFFAVMGLLALGAHALGEMGYVTDETYFRLCVGVYALCAMGAAALCELFLMALCAQARVGKWEWLKRTITGRCWLWCWGLCKKIWFKIFGKVRQTEAAEKAVGLIPKAACWIRGTYRTLPLMWQWLGLFGVLFLLTLWVASTFRYHDGIAFLLVAAVGFVIVLYTGYGFGKLRDSAKRMSQGDLDTKIDCYSEFLYGNFAEFAGDLNALGDTCVEAALAKMKSERMKSELITNVSHDIKTPLTSIINYVDLLQKAETEEQRKEYLEVLDRQSQRLKKLIEDLMEMSKASSGNVTVELAENDIIEAVNQALGEFSDRFRSLDLQIVFRQADQSIQADFDGKLLWRVLSNCLSNVCKYALPGTRVYVDVEVTDRNVLLSIKNISREPLNIPAEELMERFVRGDASRNDQGNGLGLNIAKSLMEVQGGDLELTVDGDLFKVILTLN